MRPDLRSITVLTSVLMTAAIPVFADESIVCDPDLDGDGVMSSNDLCLWHWSPCDINRDGVIDDTDATDVAALIPAYADCNANLIPDDCEGVSSITSFADAGHNGAVSGLGLGPNHLVIGDHLAGPGLANIFWRDGLGWVPMSDLTAADGVDGDAFGSAIDVGRARVIVGASRAWTHAKKAGAAYIYHVREDLVGATHKIIAPTGAKKDFFGLSVAIDGDVCAAGAIRHDVAGLDVGAAFVYEYAGTDWANTATIIPSDGGENDRFGYAIAISGDLLVVDAPKHDGAGVNAGAVYVYRYDGVSWVEEAKLEAIAPQDGVQFGYSVDLHDDLLVVGALYVDGTGVAYIFRNAGTSWTYETTLVGSNLSGDDAFGASVAAHEYGVIVGSYLSDPSAVGSSEVYDAGATYLFELDVVWIERRRLEPQSSANDDWFGGRVAATTGMVAVSAAGADANETYVYASLGDRDNDDNDIPDPCEPDCAADIDGSGSVDFGDLLLMLGVWGDCPGCVEDLDGSGAVDFGDLTLMLSTYGPCI